MVVAHFVCQGFQRIGEKFIHFHVVNPLKNRVISGYKFLGVLEASPLILESPLQGDGNMEGEGGFRRGLGDKRFGHYFCFSQ